MKAYFLLSFSRFQFVQFHSWMEMHLLWDLPLCLIEGRDSVWEDGESESDKAAERAVKVSEGATQG